MKEDMAAITRFLLIALLSGFGSAQAAERMIAYGYSNCVACHVNPQGRNLLTDYGNSVDQAQSLQGGEWNPKAALPKFAKYNHVVRSYFNDTETRTKGKAEKDKNIYFLSYQAAMNIGKKLTASFGVDYRYPIELKTMTNSYMATAQRDLWFLDFAFLKFSPKDGVAFVAGRDQLPTGINNNEPSVFIHSRNVLGNNERPLQGKLSFWSNKYMATAYFFQPSGNEEKKMAEAGVGILAERDLYENRYVVGLNVLTASSDVVKRDMQSVFARMGFTEQFGFLGEADHTSRRIHNTAVDFAQQAYLGQFFYTPREWIVFYLGRESLYVEEPFRESVEATSGKISLRFNRNVTLTTSLRKTERKNTWGDAVQAVLFVKF